MLRRRSVILLAGAVLLAAAVAVALYFVFRPGGANTSDQQNTGTIALDFVPTDAVEVYSYRVARYWGHPDGQAGRHALGKETAELMDDSRKKIGVGADELDCVTTFVLAPEQVGDGPPLTAFTTLKPYDRKAVQNAVAPNAPEVKINDRSLYRGDPNHSLSFIDDHTFVLGRPDRLESYLKHPAGKKDAPLASVLKTAGTHYAVAAVNVAALAKSASADPSPAAFEPFKLLLESELASAVDVDFDALKRSITADQLAPVIQPLNSLQKAQLATLTLDLDEQLQAHIQVVFDSTADAANGSAALSDALHVAHESVSQAVSGKSQFVDSAKRSDVLRDLVDALRAARVEQIGSTMQVEIAMRIAPQSSAQANSEAVGGVAGAARRITMSNDLKQLGLAALDYESAMGHLPQAAIYDPGGKPLLSWRVMLLPYVEEGNLYNEFHLNEPWDSAHNIMLLDKMPTVFAPRDTGAFKRHETVFQGFVGPGSALGGKDEQITLGAISSLSGTSNTILFAEAAKSVPWTKPEDIPLDEGRLLPKLGGLNRGGFLVGYCDGHVQLVPYTVGEKALHCAVNYRNTEPFTLDK